MKMHSSEQFSSSEPQEPLPVDSTSESRSKRAKKRRSKSRKVPLVEKKLTANFEPVETEIRQDEVRLIWNRDSNVETTPKLRSKDKKIHPPRPVETETVEATIDHSHDAPVQLEKIETPPSSTPRPEIQKTSPPPVKTEESSPEEFQALLDELVNERIAEEARAKAAQANAEKTSSAQDEQLSAENIDMLLSTPPSLPPEASSYRHFFWNEQTITSPAEAIAERSMLPAVETYAPAQKTEQYIEADLIPATPERAATSQPAWAEVMSAGYNVHETTNPSETVTDHTFETEGQAPVLEAVPLHNAGELQFPERMPNAHAGQNEAFDNAIPGVIPETAAVPQPAEQARLGTAELRKLSKKIKVDGVALSEMLAARRIDEEGMRAVIQTFLRGGDVRAQLTQEIINHEKSFERDPIARHQTSGQMRTVFANTSAKVAQKSYQLTKTSLEAGRVLKHAAKHAGHELRSSSFAERWPSIAAIAVIYTLIIILLIS